LVKIDETTGANWKGVYGGEGAVVGDDRASVAAPKCALVTPPTRDMNDFWSGRWARDIGAWAALDGIDIVVEITDGKEHQVALRCVDLGKSIVKVEVVHADTMEVLDTQTVKNIKGRLNDGGTYVVWSLSGRVILRLTVTNQGEDRLAIASGVFFDPVK
jgi:hypothetical protein